MQVWNRPRGTAAVVAVLVVTLAGCGGTGEPTAGRSTAGSSTSETPSVSTAPSTGSPSATASRPSSSPSARSTAAAGPATLCKDLGFVLRAAKDLRRLGEPMESTGNETTDEHVVMFSFMQAQVFARTIVDSGDAITSDVPASLRESLETVSSAGSQAHDSLTQDQDLAAAAAVMRATEVRTAEKDLHGFKKEKCG